MSHDYHVGPEDAILYDGCEECDARAARPLDGLCRLDAESYSVFRDRMLAIEFDKDDSQSYRTDNEAKLGKALYLIAVLEERHGSIFYLRPAEV